MVPADKRDHWSRPIFSHFAGSSETRPHPAKVEVSEAGEDATHYFRFQKYSWKCSAILLCVPRTRISHASPSWPRAWCKGSGMILRTHEVFFSASSLPLLLGYRGLESQPIVMLLFLSLSLCEKVSPVESMLVS